MSKASTPDEAEGSVQRTVRELVRAAGGGLLVGLPLLFTLEVWAHSFLLPSWKIVVLLAVAFVVVVGYSVVSGFRRDRSWTELLIDSVETIWAFGRTDGASATVGGVEEESEVAIDFLPAGTEVEVSFGFSAGPDGEVTVQTIGFRLP